MSLFESRKGIPAALCASKGADMDIRRVFGTDEHGVAAYPAKELRL